MNKLIRTLVLWSAWGFFFFFYNITFAGCTTRYACFDILVRRHYLFTFHLGEQQAITRDKPINAAVPYAFREREIERALWRYGWTCTIHSCLRSLKLIAVSEPRYVFYPPARRDDTFNFARRPGTSGIVMGIVLSPRSTTGPPAVFEPTHTHTHTRAYTYCIRVPSVYYTQDVYINHPQ